MGAPTPPLRSSLLTDARTYRIGIGDRLTDLILRSEPAGCEISLPAIGRDQDLVADHEQAAWVEAFAARVPGLRRTIDPIWEVARDHLDEVEAALFAAGELRSWMIYSDDPKQAAAVVAAESPAARHSHGSLLWATGRAPYSLLMFDVWRDRDGERARVRLQEGAPRDLTPAELRALLAEAAGLAPNSASHTHYYP